MNLIFLFGIGFCIGLILAHLLDDVISGLGCSRNIPPPPSKIKPPKKNE